MNNNLFNSGQSETFKPIDFVPVVGFLYHFNRALHNPQADRAIEKESGISKLCLAGYYTYQLTAWGYTVFKGLEALS